MPTGAQRITHWMTRVTACAPSCSAVRVLALGERRGPASEARQLYAVMQRGADQCVPAHRFIGIAPHDKQLPTTRRERGQFRPAHHQQRQITQQYEMNLWQQQSLAAGAKFLPRDPADQYRPRPIQETDHPNQRIRGETHIGINEHQLRKTGPLGENVTGMWFSAPPRRQRRRGLNSHPRVLDRNPPDDFRRSIRRVIIQHNDFELYVAIRQHCEQCRFNVSLLVARGNQH